MTKPAFYKTQSYPKTLLLGIHAPYNRTHDIDTYFEEFLNLAKTNGIENEIKTFITLRSIDPACFLTKGKLEEIKEICEQESIEQVLISEIITSRQSRNLSDFLECSVFDRTELILEIFEKGAVTAEGKMQVEIAILQHKKSRLSGKGIHFGQQSGAIGVRGGSGETAKEKETRYIENGILQLKKNLAKMQRARATQRKQRLNSQIPQLCLIGYTNAGKSTLLNTLTKSEVLVEDTLFATLDTTTRALFIDGKQKGVLSDTVGFIQQLPHHLIEAFKSTLSELQFADLLIQVVDLSDQNWESHIAVVQKILNDLDIQKEMLYVFNKSDLVNNLNEIIPQLELYQPHVIISSLSKKELKPLTEFLSLWKK